MRRITPFTTATFLFLLAAIVLPLTFHTALAQTKTAPKSIPTALTKPSSTPPAVPPPFVSKKISSSTVLTGSLYASTTSATQAAKLAAFSSNNCFDYYHFGSVQASVTSRTSNIAAGSELQLNGMVTNTNPYPIVNGSVYVKIYKNGDYFSKTNGGYLVDQFFAATDITIPANGQLPINFNWKVPAYSTSGSYRVATYFVEGDSNFSGLSFTDDIQGPYYDFTVASGEKDIVEFDKTKATLNGQPYQFVGFNPKVEKNIPEYITLPVSNKTSSGVIVGVDWKVYSWDGLSDSRLIATSSSALFVPVGGATTSITVFDTQHPVYYAVATITYNDSKSIAAVRFVRNGIDQIRLEDPSVASFPIKAGVKTTIFSCLHGMGVADNIAGGKLLLSLTDRSGHVIASSTYRGVVTGSMMLRKFIYTPKYTYDYAVLSAKLYLNDKLQDEYTITYDCKLIDPSLCNNPFTSVLSSPFLIGGAILILFGLLALGFYFLKKRGIIMKK